MNTKLFWYKPARILNVPLRLLIILFFAASSLAQQPRMVSAGAAGMALRLNGINQYVTFGPTAGLAELGVQVFTIETWFKRIGTGVPTTTGTGGITSAIPLVTKGRDEAEGSNADLNYFLGIDSATGVLAADFEECARGQTGCPATTSNASAGGRNYPARGVTVIQNNIWYHAAVTFDGRYWRFYLNGVQDGAATDTGANRYPRWDSIQHAGIGTALNSIGAAAGFFIGAVDEVRIWNVVRTQSEIQANMYSELASGTGLIARWGMNEGAGSTIASSVGAFPGTLVGSPIWVNGFPDNVSPIEPFGLNATGANTMVTLNWRPNFEYDLAGYNLYRGTVSGVYTRINSSLITASTYNDTGLNNSQEYFYVLRAVNTANLESANSNEAAAIPMSEFGSALQFTGSNAYVTFGDPAKLDLSTFTIETWFKRTGPGIPDTTGTNGITHAIPLLTHGAPKAVGSTAGANWMLVLNDDTDVIAADFEDMSTGKNHPVSGVTPITNDVWHHVAATWDGKLWRLFLDGKLENTSVAGSYSPRSNTTQQVGLGTMLESDGTPHGYFQGALDEARVWNRALTQSEILANINKKITNGTGLVARWGLNEGSGTAVGDSVTGPVNGVLTGTAYAWVPGAPFNLDLKPGTPTLIAPADAETGITTPAALTVHVDDPRNSNLTVSFYGRPRNDPPGPDFTMITIPDPQYYAANYPSIYSTQLSWVAAVSGGYNTAYVISLGDNVDSITDPVQWTNATTAWDILGSAGVPYGLALGNHDGAPSSTSEFNANFGDRISGQATYGGRYGTGDYDNTYALFSAGGMQFIVFFIEYDPSMNSVTHPVLEWANEILQANPTRRAIVVTHDLLDNNSNFTAQGSSIYEALKGNPNLFMLLGGHLDGSRRRTDVYNGNTVYSLRADYQFAEDMQSGYLRVFSFHPAENRITVGTYSPILHNSLVDSTNEFELPYAMNGSASFSLIGSTTVSSGSDATVTWSGLENNTAYEWYAVSSNGGDSTASPVWSFTANGSTISGNSGVAGAILSYTDGIARTVTANGSGEYSFTVSHNWSGTVTPSLTGYTFIPPNRAYTNVITHQTAQDYTATPVPTFLFSVTKTGTGSGTVSSLPAGINCGSTCSSSYNSNTQVVMTASPAPGSTFTGWSGNCTGMGTCSVTMNAAKSVTANFTLVEYSLTVNVQGSGSVGRSPEQATYHYGDVVHLTATEGADWFFSAWSGGISSSENPYDLQITGNTIITATFLRYGADLNITHSILPSAVGLGQTWSYTLTVINAGPASADNLTVTGPISARLQFISATGTGWKCDHSLGTLSCTLPELTPGSSLSFTVTVKTLINLGPINDELRVSSDIPDPILTDNITNIVTTVANIPVEGFTYIYLPTIRK